MLLPCRGEGKRVTAGRPPLRQGTVTLPANVWGAENEGLKRRCLLVSELHLAYIFTLLLKWESRNFTENRPISCRVMKTKGMWLNKITDLLIM